MIIKIENERLRAFLNECIENGKTIFVENGRGNYKLLQIEESKYFNESFLIEGSEFQEEFAQIFKERPCFFYKNNFFEVSVGTAPRISWLEIRITVQERSTILQ